MHIEEIVECLKKVDGTLNGLLDEGENLGLDSDLAVRAIEGKNIVFIDGDTKPKAENVFLKYFDDIDFGFPSSGSEMEIGEAGELENFDYQVFKAVAGANIATNGTNIGSGSFSNGLIDGVDVQIKPVGIPDSYEVLNNEGKNTPEFYELKSNEKSANLFHDTIEKISKSNPYGASVEVKSVEDYKNLRVFLTKDGKSGFALSKNGDVESVFSAPKSRRGDAIIASAVKAGGKSLDCYSIPKNGKGKNEKGGLVQLYERAGFKEVARVEINPEYDDTNGKAEYVSIMGIVTENNEIKQFDMNGYDDAIEYRDNIIKLRGK